MKMRCDELTAEHITEYWGERCSAFEPTCFVCILWRLYDDTERSRKRLGRALSRTEHRLIVSLEIEDDDA